MPTNTCERCGREFQAKTKRGRYCHGACFRAHEASQNNKRRLTWSPERRRASAAVATAIYNGSLKRQPCEVCGAKHDIDAHHDDYSKPLEVRWLCRSHHRQHHIALRNQSATTEISA